MIKILPRYNQNIFFFGKIIDSDNIRHTNGSHFKLDQILMRDNIDSG